MTVAGTIPSLIAPANLSWLGIGRELVTGTPVLPATTIPLDKGSYSPEDTPHFLPDEAIRGSMALLYNEILGVEDATFSFGGPLFFDTAGYWLDNVFGDMSTTSNGTLGTASTFGTVTVVGATSFTTSSSIGTAVPVGAIVQISDGAASEVVVATSGSTGTTINCTNDPLRFPHTTAATAALQSAATNYTHTFALLNGTSYNGSYGAQPPTHSVTDFTGLTATVGGRTYPSACVSQIDFTGNAEQLLMVKVTGNSWVSAPAASKPTNTTTFTAPLANWLSTVTLGGSQIYDIGEWALSIKRTLQIYWTAQNSQNPYVIARGPLNATATLNFTVPSSEQALTEMLNNSQPALVFTLSNGLTGTSELSVTCTMSKAAFVKAKPTRNAVLVGFDDEIQAVANTTDVGGTGGLGPCTVQLINAVATY